MISKQIRWFGDTMIIACDGRCDKAFGINGRPMHYFSKSRDLHDDNVELPDRLVGTAPPPGQTVGISEGSDCKPSAEPLADGSRMNKWCARECERDTMVKPGEPIVLPDMENPVPNMPHRRGQPMPWEEGGEPLRTKRRLRTMRGP